MFEFTNLEFYLYQNLKYSSFSSFNLLQFLKNKNKSMKKNYIFFLREWMIVYVGVFKYKNNTIYYQIKINLHLKGIETIYIQIKFVN